MIDNPLADVVSNQYERWVYPQPILDLQAWLASNWQWFDPSHAHTLFWPDREYWPGMDILVAGCGTNQAAVIAYTNPEAHIIAVDVSQSSLNHHRYLKEKYKLDNLEMHQLPIEKLPSLKRDFDLVISTGVLHHLADPQKGLDALASCLRKDGVIALMLYAHYGRMGLEIVQSLFRDMGFDQTEMSILMVRDALASLPQDHPVWSYIKMAPDLQYDAGLVDTFLHGREKNYTINECIQFAEASHLVFQDIFIKAPYYSHVNGKSAFLTSVAALPERQQWAAMERVSFRNACHFFTVCHSGRDTDCYKIDFTSSKILDFKPCLRFRCGLEGSTLFRPDWRMQLSPQQLAFVRHIDGKATIRQITECAQQNKVDLFNNGEDMLAYGVQLFHSLWKLDFIAIKI